MYGNGVLSPESPSARVGTPRAPQHPDGPLDGIPVLGLLAAVAALASLAVNGFLVQALAGAVPHPTLIQLDRWGDLPRNLAAIAGTIALGAALYGFLRYPRYAPIRRRLLLAGFAGIFIPTVALAAILPAERVPVDVIQFSMSAASILTVFFGLTGLRWPAPRSVRLALGLLTASVFLAFGWFVLDWLDPLTGWGSIALVLRRAGEIAYLAVPLVAAGGTLPLLARERRIGGLVAFGATTLVVLAAFIALRLTLRADFAIVLYGAQRVEILLDAAPLVYAFPLSVAFGVAAAALASRDGTFRQAGTALLLVVAGGYAPRAPAHLLMMVLGAALLSRVAIALAERRFAHAPAMKPSEKPRRAAPPEANGADRAHELETERPELETPRS